MQEIRLFVADNGVIIHNPETASHKVYPTEKLANIGPDIVATLADLLGESAPAGDVAADNTTEAPPADEKPKRRRRTKAQIEADKKAAEEAKAEASKSPEADAGDAGAGEDDAGEPAAAPTKTHADLRALNQRVSKSEGHSLDDIRRVFKEFGFKKVDDVPAEKLDEVYAAVEAILG